MCKDLYFYMNSCFYQFWVQHKQVGQRQLFAEFKVTKGELQLCETPLTHYHLPSAPFTNKGQVHYWLLEEKNSFKSHSLLSSSSWSELQDIKYLRKLMGIIWNDFLKKQNKTKKQNKQTTKLVFGRISNTVLRSSLEKEGHWKSNALDMSRINSRLCTIPRKNDLGRRIPPAEQ